MFQNCSFAKRPRVAHMLNHGWWLLAVGGWRRLPVGGWQLVVVGGSWWRLAAVGGGWRLVGVGGWRLVLVGSWWRLAISGWWSLGAVLKGSPQQKKKKTGSLRTPWPSGACVHSAGTSRT